MNNNKSSEPIETLVVHILGKDYQVSCPINEREDLVRAAKELDKRMRDIRNSGNVLGGERIAVMAALNLANEVLHSGNSQHDQYLLDDLHQRLDNILNQD